MGALVIYSLVYLLAGTIMIFFVLRHIKGIAARICEGDGAVGVLPPRALAFCLPGSRLTKLHDYSIY